VRAERRTERVASRARITLRALEAVHALRPLVAAAVTASMVALPASSYAQSRTGFAVDRFEPAEHGTRQFVVDSLDLRPGTAAAGATLDYAYKPLVLYDASGTERFALVRHQTFMHLGGAIVVAQRLRLAVDAPVALYQDGESATVAGERLSAANAPAFGDVRLAADVRLLGDGDGDGDGDGNGTADHRDASFALAAGVRAWLPTGLRSQFTGDGSARVAPQVLAASGSGPFLWAARTALVYRSRDDAYAGRTLGSELFFAAGIFVRTRDERVVVGPELSAASAFTGGAKFLGKHETPVEWLFGAHVDVVRNLRVGAGVGSGLGRGYGAPSFRGLLSIAWVTSPPPPARSKDDDGEERTPWEGYGGGGNASGNANGNANGNGDGNGNGQPRPPLAVVTEDEIHIADEIPFAVDSADLVSPSDEILSAVKRVLDEHPELRKLRIEGHTDSTGDPAYNDDLSARRALAVFTWLTTHGIDAARLESVGRGSRAPLDSNETETGRAKNRRVVFKILEREGPAR
jgi:OOP family OmpA-OmpF porin